MMHLNDGVWKMHCNTKFTKASISWATPASGLKFIILWLFLAVTLPKLILKQSAFIQNGVLLTTF